MQLKFELQVYYMYIVLNDLMTLYVHKNAYYTYTFHN